MNSVTCGMAGLAIVFLSTIIETRRKYLFATGTLVLGLLIILYGAYLKGREQGTTHPAFAETCVSAFQRLEDGQKITGKEYLALDAMVQEEDQEQLKEVAKRLGVDPQKIIALMSDSDRVSVERDDALPWDGKIVHHL